MIQRDTPREGEWWKFSNGKTARVAEVTDQNYGAPEIAYTNPRDYRTAFKFNSKHDPMPVKRLRHVFHMDNRFFRLFIAF
jgi:hypothetical protein